MGMVFDWIIVNIFPSHQSEMYDDAGSAQRVTNIKAVHLHQ